jgi:hypothetical protein
MNIFKMMLWISKGDKIWYGVPVENQVAYLNSFKEPDNDVQRSYYQYKCQNRFRSHVKIFALGFISMFAYPLLLVYYLIKGALSKSSRHIDAIGEYAGMTELIPDELNDEYDIDNSVWKADMSITLSDLPYVLNIAAKRFYSPYFALKCLSKIAQYSSYIRIYSPRAIIVHAEYSFTSSILTNYCEKHGVKQINAMHGEKIYYIGYAFFRYSECYVWSEYYQNLLTDLRAEPNQFKISVPLALKIDCSSNFREDQFADYKYYLQTYTEDELIKILDSLSFIKQAGKTVKFRPHPRFSDIALLEKHVPKEQIEYPRNVNILISIASCNTVIGFCSTVLYQGYLNGKSVILDDVTFETGYKRLLAHRYILGNMHDVTTLSQFATNNNA